MALLGQFLLLVSPEVLGFVLDFGLGGTTFPGLVIPDGLVPSRLKQGWAVGHVRVRPSVPPADPLPRNFPSSS